MKTIQIVFGIILVLFVGLMLKASFVFAEPIALPILSLFVVFVLLMLLFVYQMMNNMVRMQEAIDKLSTELIRVTEALEEKKEPADPIQIVTETKNQDIPWDNLDQAEKDEHIAKIRKSMEYIGDTSCSGQEMGHGQPLFH